MSKIFVTGAAGHLGQAVIHHLLETEKVPASSVIAGSRDTSKLADLAGKGVEVRAVDFDKPEEMADAFAGVDKLLIISTDSVGSGERLNQHKRAVAAAAKAGVGRIFYTSLPSPETSLVSFAGDHLGTEEAIKATGIPFTILRNCWYMENLLMALPQALAGGTWYTSSGEGRIAYIARDDIARATAAALMSDNTTDNVTLTLAGTESFTVEEVAAKVSAVTGKPLAVMQLTDEQLAGGMKGAGVPEAIIPMLVSFDASTREGDLATTTDAFKQLTGRKPQTLGDFLEANKAALAG